MKKITVLQIMKWGPCDRYSFFKVCKLIKFGKTPLEILDLSIPIDDRFWLVLREEVIPAKKLHFLACDFAQSVAHLNPDPRVQAAIDAKRKWIAGEISNDELADARFIRAVVWEETITEAARDAAYAARNAAYIASVNIAGAVWYAVRNTLPKGVGIDTAFSTNVYLEMVRKVLKGG